MANPTPAITFRADLTLQREMAFGPSTNESTVGARQIDSTIDLDTRRDQLSTFLPSFQVASNRVLTHGDEFTEYGQKAVYLRDTYGIGYAPSDRAVLVIVSVE